MLQLVARPVAQGSVAGDTIVGKGATPHDFGPCIVIIGLLEGDFSVAHHIAQQGSSNIINQGELFGLLACKITL